ncbi:MAG: hypothetical protein DRJ45_04970 [Thermoprotei archaeon]|nr:MAG: hypothetical protein DRJ45_04970 [Thermoprotei archaeon]
MEKVFYLSFILDSWREDIKPIVRNKIEELDKIGVKILDWNMNEDELKLNMVLIGPKNIINVLNNIHKIFSNLLKRYDIKIINIVNSELKFLDINPSFIKSMLNLWDTYIEIFKLIREKGWKIFFDNKFKDKFIKLGLIDYNLNLTTRGESLKHFRKRIDKFIQKYHILLGLNKNKLIILSALYFMNNRDINSFLNLIGLLYPEINVIEILDELRNNGTIHISRNMLTLDRNLEKFWRDLNEIVTLLERNSYGKGVLEKVFEKIDEKVDFIILGNGDLSSFSSLKILESLVKAGIDMSKCIRVVDKLYERKIDRIVSSREIASNIVNILNILYPSILLSAKYDFYINTRKYLYIEGGKPFTYRNIRKMVEDRWFKKISLKPISSVVDEIIENIYDSIRDIYLSSSPWLYLSRKNIEIPLDLIGKVIDENIRTSMQYVDQLLYKDKIQIMNDILGKINTYIDRVKFIKKVVKLNETLSQILLNKIKYMVYDFSSILLICLNIIPGSDPMVNLLALVKRTKMLRKGVKDENLMKFYNRIIQFTRLSINQFNSNVINISILDIIEKILLQINELKEYLCEIK